MTLEHRELTSKIIEAAYKVHKNLGSGFLEKIYHNALTIELDNAGIKFISQFPIPIYYEGILVGDYYADLFVENKIIVELKAVDHIHLSHEIQLVNYLTATKIDNGLLINFGSEVAIKRKFRSYRKKL